MLATTRLAHPLLAAGLTGQYVGDLTITGPEGTRADHGAIVIKQSGDTLTITAGPSLDRQGPATNVQLDGDKLTFHFRPPHRTEGEPWKFDLKIEAKRLTGTITASENGQTLTAQLDFAKQ